MKSVDSLLRLFVVNEVDEPEAPALALFINGKQGRGDTAKLVEELLELLLGGLRVQVLDVEVGELRLHLVKLGLALLAGDVVPNVDLFVVEQHAVDSLDGVVGGLASLVVHEAVALGATVLISSNLAGQNVAEGSERVVESLVVNELVQVLDEDIALSGLAEGRVTLGPHDAAVVSRASVLAS